MQLGGDLPRQRAEIHRLVSHLPASDAREIEQGVDQLPHALGGRADTIQVVPTLLIQLVPGFREQRRAEAVHRPQRGAQVVRHRIGKRLQLAVGLLQFGRPLAHAHGQRVPLGLHSGQQLGALDSQRRQTGELGQQVDVGRREDLAAAPFVAQPNRTQHVVAAQQRHADDRGDAA